MCGQLLLSCSLGPGVSVAVLSPPASSQCQGRVLETGEKVPSCQHRPWGDQGRGMRPSPGSLAVGAGGGMGLGLVRLHREGVFSAAR